VFDHINLYGENSPCYRPVVLYKGEAPVKEFKASLALACDVLREYDGNSQSESATDAAKALLSATRVEGAQDLLEAVTVRIF
jgi:hypothetical protein